jgi:hypothetical protein
MHTLTDAEECDVTVFLGVREISKCKAPYGSDATPFAAKVNTKKKAGLNG